MQILSLLLTVNSLTVLSQLKQKVIYGLDGAAKLILVDLNLEEFINWDFLGYLRSDPYHSV
jgi:hypothetical protein